MHVEPLEKLPRSVREFLSHYAMIVLSILTALALEQVALGLEHRHEGQRAREEIEQEIASNRAAVEDALKITQVNLKEWKALMVAAVAQEKAGQASAETRLATLTQARQLFSDALPPLKTAAWDASLSDHSVNYLEHADLSRYAELYAAQRLFAQAMWDSLRDSGQRELAGITLAVSLDKADAATTLALLNGRLQTIGIVESQLAQLDEALKGTPDAAPPAAASAASR
jgi:hypothetical protein